MKWILDRLELWRKERGLDITQGFEFSLDIQVSFLTEEITEYLRSKYDYDRIDALCDLTVFSINAINLIDNDYSNVFSSIYCLQKRDYDISDLIEEILDICRDESHGKYQFINIIEISKYMIENMNFDYDKCMEETLLEIESRKGALNPDTEKWEKFKDEESMNLWYKADYKSCKL